MTWTWSAPGTISNINYFVQQVSDATSTTPSGFNSGSASVSGIIMISFEIMMMNNLDFNRNIYLSIQYSRNLLLLVWIC